MTQSWPPATTAVAAAGNLAAGEVIQPRHGHAVVSLGVQQVDAEVAVLDYDPAAGDRVLVAGDSASGYFLIGVMSTTRPRPRLVVDAAGATRIQADEGDLQLAAPRGTIRITAADGVEAHSAGPIDFRSAAAVRASVIDHFGRALSHLGLTRNRTQLRNDRLDVVADSISATSSRVNVDSEKLTGEFGAARISARTAALDVETLTSAIGNVYQKVTGLWQLAAGRTRMIVRGTSHHKAKRLYSKAEDVKVKSEKIHLG